MNATDLHEQSTGDLARKLSRDASDLARKELGLAKAEVTAKARRLGMGAGLIAVAALLALAMIGALTAAAILALDLVVAGWLSALIVGVAVGVVAAGLLLLGLRSIRRATPPIPSETVESVKEDLAWIRTQAKSGMR